MVTKFPLHVSNLTQQKFRLWAVGASGGRHETGEVGVGPHVPLEPTPFSNAQTPHGSLCCGISA